MINISVKIDRSVDTVWEYFTTPGNWTKWYGTGVKKVDPGWQKGAKLIWSSRGHSAIKSIDPGQEICISGAWMDTTYRFKTKGNTGTTVEIVESAPRGGASFSDGGAAHKTELKKTLQKLKECIENETDVQEKSATSSTKKWWEFWK
jgi:uncharacterized protein YndB with AHSA1/START domain